MIKLKLFSIIIAALLISCLFAQSAFATFGDVDGDGYPFTLADLLYLDVYLINGGPTPPNPNDADFDGSPGINLGDLLQFTYFLIGSCNNFVSYTGIAPAFGNIEFTLPRLEPGTVGVQFSVPLKLSDNPGPDLVGIVIPFSYQNLPGYVSVSLDSVGFTGSIVPSQWAHLVYIDNSNKKALLMVFKSNPGYNLSAGTIGNVATLYFTRTQTGNPTCMTPTFYPPTHTPMLFSAVCADGTPPSARVFIPKIGKKGDPTSDGAITVSDVTFLTRYLFQGGPPPCGW